MGWDDTWGADWSTVVAMCTLMLLGWGALAAVIWLGLRAAGTFPETPPTDPARLLDARFARGEVSEEEYLTARSLLDAHAPGSEMQGSQLGPA